MSSRRVREVTRILLLVVSLVFSPVLIAGSVVSGAKLGLAAFVLLGIAVDLLVLAFAWQEQRIRRAREAAGWLLEPSMAVARQDAPALRAQLAAARSIALGPRHPAAAVATVYAAWLGLRPSSDLALVRWPDERFEELWAALDEAKAIEGEPPRPPEPDKVGSIAAGALVLAYVNPSHRSNAGIGLEMLGTVLFFTERFATAVAVFSAAYDLHPGSRLAYNAACATARNGRLDEAGQWLSKVHGPVTSKASMLADEDLVALRTLPTFAGALRHQRRTPVRNRFVSVAMRGAFPTIQYAVQAARAVAAAESSGHAVDDSVADRPLRHGR